MKFDPINEDMIKLLELSDDTQLMLVCSVRYAIGRQTYMPSFVQDYMRTLLPKLSDNTLNIIKRDIEEAPYLGDERIDKPGWVRFCADVTDELNKRTKS